MIIMIMELQVTLLLHSPKSLIISSFSLFAMSLEEAFAGVAEQVHRVVVGQPVEDHRLQLCSFPSLFPDPDPSYHAFSFPPALSYSSDGKLATDPADLGYLAMLVHLIHERFSEHSQQEDAFEQRPFSVLEPGCGVGTYTLMLGYRFPNWQITGFDIRERATEEAEKRRRQADQHNVSFQSTDLAEFNGSFGDYNLLAGYRLCMPFADRVLQRAVAERTPYLMIVPCCTFRIIESHQNRRPVPLLSCSAEKIFPSCLLRRAYQRLDMKIQKEWGLPYHEYRVLASSFLLLDRALFLEENGYQTALYALDPRSYRTQDPIPVLVASKKEHPARCASN